MHQRTVAKYDTYLKAKFEKSWARWTQARRWSVYEDGKFELSEAIGKLE